MKKIKVDAIQASEFMAAGYAIECYVIIPQAKLNGPVRKVSPQIMPDTKLALSLEGTPPAKGIYREVWNKVAPKLWRGDLTKVATRKQIEEAISAAGFTHDPSFLAYVTNKKKCLRVIE